MKNYVSFILVLVGLCISQISFAGDVLVRKVLSLYPVEFANQDAEVEFQLENIENFSVNNINAQINIRGIPSNDLVFQDQVYIDEVEAMNIQIIKSPVKWHPTEIGNFRLEINLTSDNDINPTNDNFNFNFEVVPPPSFNFFQVNMMEPFQNPFSNYGLFSVQFPPLAEPLFVNILAQSFEFGSGNIWLVKNMPLLPFTDPQQLDYWFDLTALQLPPTNPQLQQLNVQVRFDYEILPDGFNTEMFYPAQFNPFNYDVLSDNVDAPGGTPPDEEQVGDVEFKDTTDLDTLYRGCKMPNVDLDRSENPASGEYAGDRNACGPAAAANSLQWLEETNDNIPSSDTDLREKLKELSAFMERQNEAGVTTEQLIKGKLAFIDKYKLPIHVKYQSWFVTDNSINSPNSAYGHKASNEQDGDGRKPPTWEFLKSEMEKGEDVELMFGWYDREKNRNNGHWITVTGLKTDGKARGIYFKDDADQKNADGTRQTYIHWKTNENGWSRLVGFDGPNNYCWVESIVSESYDPNVTFDPTSKIKLGTLGFKVSELDALSQISKPLRLIINAEANKEINISAYDISGRELYKQGKSVISGINSYIIPSYVLGTKGLYIISISEGNNKINYRIVRY